MSGPYAAMAAAIVLGCGVGFQLLLAAGLPWGKAAWGGQHVVLPAKLRLGSVAAAGLLGLAAWAILARAGFVGPGAGSGGVRIATWVFAGYLGLNTLGNLASRSRVERLVMTPLAALLAVCFVVVALS